MSKHYVIVSDDEAKRSESSRHSESAEEVLKPSYLHLCKSEIIYVDERLDLHLWDRISVPCALRMRSNKSCVKTF